jgi:hypothetical protein
MKTITLQIPDTQFWAVLRFLQQIENAKISYANKADEMNLSVFSQLAKPIQKSMSVAGLCKTQNYQGINRSRFSQLREKLAIEESVEELIALL